MKKSELVEIIAKKAHLTKKASKEAVESLFSEVSRVLKKGEKVTISGFGTFKVSKVRDKKGRKSPKDPTPVVHKAHRVVRFVVAKTLKRAVK
ncbi:HU family DNA-binding protein [Patescibacteria group bacterium]